MYAIDAMQNTRELESRIEHFVSVALNPERNNLEQLLEFAGSLLLKRVLPNKCRSNSEMGSRFVATLQNMSQITAIVENIYSELVRQLSGENDRTKMTALLCKYLKMTEEEAKIASDEMKTFTLIDRNEILNFTSNHGDPLTNFKRKLENCKFSKEYLDVSEFVRKLSDSYFQVDRDYRFSKMEKSVADKITEKILRIQSNLGTTNPHITRYSI